MARKRGGLAGLWDRGKKIIKPVATLGAGLLGGPAAGALVGGMIGGLDREGEGGIGFDVGRGAIGAASGYGMGKMGGALKSGVMSRLGGGGMDAMGAKLNALGPGIDRAVSQAGSDVAASIAQGGGVVPSSVASVGNAMSTATTPWYKDGKMLMGAGQALMGGMNAIQNNQAMRMQRDAMERRNRMEDEDRRRSQAMDPVRAQLLAQIMRRIGGGVA